ncbi:hypothetical protein BT96DRAFT_986227 [Gymnopus androsaceus JB14]|uniref:Epoxide hydrolase N-terminal domain-containing protein n=1 Tax=Gymnopus androsaceus JB14 TaxID=1447944 RepID=A0A6A4I7L5_9AGAR|nr:hypothetical protein BT96DRAFT_986227 [Gymnopus androsaceus JB14]
MSETPFRITIPDSKLAILQQKLEVITYPDKIENFGWKHGVPFADIKRLVAHWKDFPKDIDVDGFGKLNILMSPRKAKY